MISAAPSTPAMGLTPELFAKAFPFHLALDRSMKLLQAGAVLRRICPDVRPGVDLGRIFIVALPKGPMKFDHLLENPGRFFLLEHHSKGLRLRGEFVRTTDETTLLFLGSPWFNDASEMVGLGLGYEDFAIHDPMVDVLQVFQANKQSLADTTRLATKLTEERTKLRATASRLEALLRNLHLSVVVEDADHRIVLVNQSYLKVFRIPATQESLVGMDSRDHDRRCAALFREPEGYVERILSTLRDRVPVLGEECIMHDGRVLERDSLPIFSEGRHTGTLWIYHDATDRRRAADELRAEKDLLASNLGSIEDGVITVDASRQVQLINPAAEAMTGRTIADAVGRPINELLHLVDLNKCSDENQLSDFLGRRLSATDGDSRRKLFILRSNGVQDRIIDIGVHPVLGASRTVESGLLVFRDVSKDFETDRMKEDFIDSVSHELRSPLTSIRGFIDTILADPQMPDETRLEFLKIIRFQSWRLSQLVDNILDMSSVDAGATLYEDEPLQLGNVVTCSLAEVGPQADLKGVHIEASIQPGLPGFTGDAIRLQSAVSNFLGNAVKFTPKGGQVRLELRMDKGEVHLSIRDTGLGIAEEHLDRIFEKFYRVPRPGQQIAGTGLGLPIAAAIIEHYGGRIKVESQVDQGSCFHIFLPLESPSPP